MTQPIWTTTDPAEVTKRLAEYRCLGCNLAGMNLPVNLDKDTGFPAQYCDGCKEHNRQAGPHPNAGAAKARKAHKAGGLDNLDRPMGGLK